VKVLASDIDDFIGRYVFGQDAALFGGAQWAKELRDAGVLL
jgi:hypothetical protein